MTKEIIVNAGELESRVAILENGRLMEVHIEREPKIVGNIYRGRVTKVLKGMDAAFVDIGVERNAFLAASDIVPEEEDEEDNGRPHRRNVPPITTLIHNNQEITVQVLRAPMGTKGARVTTRLSLPGRYTVLMLNSGSYVGVSRKIEDAHERQRLRALANRLRPEGCSLIVRTEAEGKSDEELEGDIRLLLDLKTRIDAKTAHATAPSIIHGDLTLIFRLIRDAFTRDVSRVVVDSPDVYENVLELVEMIAPGMKHRVFLYDEPLPIFHAYNIEPEIERLLRRRVWLPSGGHLVIDQAEALTAIDVNTGRFVGSTELAETVLTTNLQAADEVARQLRVRDLGGIIVVDFIDMDNPRHRQQVMRAFEDALKHDRAKIKVHSISALGLVEMTRKRTGDSMTRLLTEPCPYCSGIGRVQNPLTMALRIERELAANSVVHPETESFLVYAHPRVVASMLGYEGEAHRDLEQYIGHPVYFRAEDDYHPNTYRLERLTLEQALQAVPHLEDEDIVEGQVVNPDPDLSLEPLVSAKGIFIVVPGLDAPVGARVKVKITQAGTSMAFGEPLAEELRGVRAKSQVTPRERPPLVPESVLPAYLRDELALVPPDGMSLLSPTSSAIERDEENEFAPEPTHGRRERPKRGRRERVKDVPLSQPTLEEAPVDIPPSAPPVIEVVIAAEAPAPEADDAAGAKRRRRRRGGRGRSGRSEMAPLPSETSPEPVTETVIEETIPADETPVEPIPAGVNPAEPAAKRRRRRGGRRHKRSDRPFIEPVALEPQFEAIPPDVAAEALLTMISAIDDATPPPLPVEPMPADETPVEPEPPKPRRRATRRPKKTAEAEPQLTLEPEPLPEPAPATAPEPEPAPEPPARKPRAPRKPRVKKED